MFVSLFIPVKNNKKKQPKNNEIESEIHYVEFLKKRINSSHFRANVSSKEFEKTKKKYDKAKLKLKMMRQGLWK